MSINDNWVPGRYFTVGEDAASVTIAHEYFHAIQFGINENHSDWWAEATAVWAEDIIYDSVNDYEQYLDQFYDYPYLALNAVSGPGTTVPLHEYAANVFPRFISDRLGDDEIQKIWEEFVTYDTALEAINEALKYETYTFDVLFDSFLIDNYTRDHKEGRLENLEQVYETTNVHVYSTTSIAYGQTINVDRTQDQEELPRGLGANYLRILPPGNLYGDLQISFDGDDSTPWSFQVIKRLDTTYNMDTTYYYQVEQLTLDTTDNTAVTTLSFFGHEFYSEIVLVPAALTWLDEDYFDATGYEYSYSLHLEQDTTAPKDVRDLTAATGFYEATLSWSNPDDFDYSGAMIRRNTTSYPASENDGQLIASAISPLAEYSDHSVLDQDYYYTVFAFDGIPNYAAGVTALVHFATDTTPPGAPINVTPLEVDENHVKLSWSKPADADLKGIAIYRGSYPNTSGTPVYDGLGTDFSDGPLTHDTTYYYSLYAYDKAINTNYSAAVTVLVNIPVDVNAPSAPQPLTRTPYNGYIRFTWSDPAESDYEGVRFAYDSTVTPATPNDGTYVQVPKNTQMVEISGLDNDTRYYFSVFSYDEIPNYSSPVQLSEQPDGVPPLINTVVLPNPIFKEYLDINIISTEELQASLSAGVTFNGSDVAVTLGRLPNLYFVYQGSYTLPDGSSGNIVVEASAQDIAGNTAYDTTSFATKMVMKRDGATLANSKNNVTLTIPGGAMSKDANVTLLPVSKYTYKTPLALVGEGVNIYSPKAEFQSPVSLSFDYSGQKISPAAEKKLGLYHYDDGQWVFVSNNFSEQKITISTKLKGAYALFIDEVPPLITSISPNGGRKFKFKNPEISANIDDIGCGVDPASITLTVNSERVPVRYNPKTGKISAGGFRVVDGPNTFVLQAADKVDNISLPITTVALATGKVEFGKVFAYPNPAHDKTTIRYESEKPNVNISLMIFDLAGELVFHKDEIYRESQEVSYLTYDYTWRCRNDRGKRIGSGIYIYRMEMTSDGKSDTYIGKLAVVR